MKRTFSHRSQHIVNLNLPTNADFENAMISTTEVYKSRYTCQRCIISVDEDGFDFYPVSFVPYLIFIIIVTLLILYELIAIEIGFNHYYTETESMYHMLTDAKLQFNSDTFFSVNLGHYHNNNDDITIITGWFLLYFMIIISVWDSLFSFYRYYVTMNVATRFESVSTIKIIKYFSIYAIPYFIIYLLQIHVYYFLFPILIISHFVINVWCNWMFAKILIESTMQFAKTERMVTTIHDDMLKSVYFMRRASLIWCFISSLCQSAFVITYCIEIMYFYPILWCIGCVSFTLNFVRNRTEIFQYLFHFSRTCNICKKIRKIYNQPQIPQQIEMNVLAVEKEKKSDFGETVAKMINLSIDSLPNNMTSSACTASSVSCENDINMDDIHKDEDKMIYYNYTDANIKTNDLRPTRNTLQVRVIFSDEDEDDQVTDEEDFIDIPVKTKSHKALELLGLTPKTPFTSQKNVYNIPKNKNKDKVLHQLQTNIKFSALRLAITTPFTSKKNLDLINFNNRSQVRSVSAMDPIPDCPFLKNTNRTISDYTLNSSQQRRDSKESLKEEKELHTIEIQIQAEENENINDEKVPKFATEITNKLEAMQKKLEAPSIVRRLEYENKLKPSPQISYSSSVPSSPEKIVGDKNKKKQFGDDTEIEYNYHFCEKQKNQEKEGEMHLEMPLPIPLSLHHSASKSEQRPRMEKSAFVKTLVSNYTRNRRNSVGLLNTDSQKSKSSSVQINIDHKIKRMWGKSKLRNERKKNLDADELVSSLNVLVQQGFYSRKALNSMQQLRRYNCNTTIKQ